MGLLSALYQDMRYAVEVLERALPGDTVLQLCYLAGVQVCVRAPAIAGLLAAAAALACSACAGG